MIKFATMQHHLPTTTLASFYALLALFFSFHEAHGQTPKPQAKNMAESLTVFKELFAIGLPGQKDVKILNREGIKKIPSSTSSQQIVTESKTPSLKNVNYNGGTKDGVIILAKIEIQGTTQFLEEIKKLVEERYKITFPEAKVKSMDFGPNMKIKIISYQKVFDDRLITVSSTEEGDTTTCGFNITDQKPGRVEKLD